MNRSDRTLHFGLFLRESGHHVASWRHPAAPSQVMQLSHYQQLAETVERGLMDFIFLADHPAIANGGAAQTRSGEMVRFEPLTLLTALAMKTRHIGLIATASTTYGLPYAVARSFSSLDHLSDGRAGWNVVTSVNDSEAANFGDAPHMEHDARYERAAEFLQVVEALWDSWGDDAFLVDKSENGLYYDPERMRVPNHKGTHFSVRGPLNIARSPSGRPVIVQAGSSGVGRDFAAKKAEVVFTATPDFDEARSFYTDVKARAQAHGRAAEDMKIMPGVLPIVAQSRAEAEDLFEELQALMDPQLGLSQLARLLGGVDVSDYPLDGPLPDLPLTNARRGRFQVVLDMARREQLTIRQLYLKLAGSRTHWKLAGTPQDVADQLEHWFLGEACDGFNLLPPLLPRDLNAFVDLLVPELQRRGLYRTAYPAQGGLRATLGLQRPNA